MEHPIFGKVIYAYTRAQAIEDGVLVDVTEWASADKGFLGGFTCPVAVTAAVWTDLNAGGELRGRAHDLLWMSSLAARAAARQNKSEALFQVLMQVGRTKKQTYKINAGPGDDGALVITIMQRHED